MDNSLARLNLTEIFCDIDDFYQVLERVGGAAPQLPCGGEEKQYRSKLSLSEVRTIVITLHSSGYRTFKEFYTLQVLPGWKKAFPELVNYNRFIELMPWSLMGLLCFLNTCAGEMTGGRSLPLPSRRAMSMTVNLYQKWLKGYLVRNLHLNKIPINLE
jgi:hypothetical protein